MALGIQALPATANFGVQNLVYAATGVSATSMEAKLLGDPSAVQGEDDVTVTVELENTDKISSISFNSAELALDPATNVVVSGGTTGTVTLDKGDTMTLTFKVSVGKFAETGSRTLSLKLKKTTISETTEVYSNPQLGNFEIYEKTGTPNNGSGKYAAALDISQSISPESGLASGQDNKLTISIKNIGNTVVKNAVLTLTLPDGLSIYNGSNKVNLGYINTTSTRNVSFAISVDDSATSKNYQITAALTGLDYSNESVSAEQVLYVPVAGSGASVGNLEVTGINVPDEVSGQDPFTLSFNVQNKSSVAVKNVKIAVDVPEGLLNQSRSTFVAATIGAGESKNYEVKLFADDSAKEKAYTIKISLSSSTASDSASDTITEYASVYVNGVSGEKTPQLMVDNYSYGGTFVQAGDDFLLELGLRNTSGSKAISNIKVTVTSEDGSIIPANSSNSFFIEKLSKKERIDHALMLSVKPAAEQKTTPLTVEMSYEDGSGNAFTTKDVISIPVMQETRLEVDDIIAPPELYAGMQGGVSVQFYNMGKTTLNNLRVTAEGDFDTPESTSYFVGNMESGKSDTYDFMFIPRQGGTLEGKVTFTYEDAAGDQQVLERPFSFEVMAEMPAMDEGIPSEDAAAGAGGHKKLWIALGVLTLFVVGGIVAWRMIRKRKMHREMEIDE
jgi:uncharacterized repeat protein (TIGR01451 family)